MNRRMYPCRVLRLSFFVCLPLSRRRLFTKIGNVISIEGSVVGEAAFIIDEGWLLARGYALVGEEQALFGDVFFGGVVQLVFE